MTGLADRTTVAWPAPAAVSWKRTLSHSEVPGTSPTTSTFEPAPAARRAISVTAVGPDVESRPTTITKPAYPRARSRRAPVPTSGTNGRAFRASSRQTGRARSGSKRAGGEAGAISMADWGDSPPAFDRSGDAWGSAAAAFDDGAEGGGEQHVEMIGSDLWVAGTVDLGRFR